MTSFSAGSPAGPALLTVEGPFLGVIIKRPGQPVASAPPFIEQTALIDTGASEVCINLRTARELGLKAIDICQVGVVGGHIEATVFAGIVEVPELGFSRLMRLYAPKQAAPSSLMLLGRSFLSHFIMTFDGPNDTFHFFNPNSGWSDLGEDG